jgi:hypothetical protein
LQVWHGKQITAAIRNSSTAEQLAALLHRHIDSMNSISLSAAIMKLSKLQVQQPQLYDACVKRYLQFAAADSTRNLSNVVYYLCTAPQVIRQQHHAALQQHMVPAFMANCAQANAQDISNVLYGMADSDQQLPEEAVQQLLAVFVRQLQQADPQGVANTLWAVATMGQQVPAGQLQQLLDALVAKLLHANPQNVSNTLWAVATMGQQMPAGQLQQLLNALVGQLRQAKPQGVSNTLWALATMGQQVPARQLQQLLDSLIDQLHQGNPQDVSNTLLACAKLGFLPQCLLAAPGLAGLLAAGTPQALANAAWACGQLGHRDEQLMAALLAEVQQRLVPERTSSSCSLDSQGLCNLCWAVAVLDLQQHAQQVLQLVTACSSIRGSLEVAAEHQQLWQVHTWLLDNDLAGGQGLQGSLTQQQLQQCAAAWDEQLRQVAKQRVSEYQRSVFAAVQRLPITWQQRPQMEQLSVGRDGVTPDGALLIDIAGRTADGVLVAVEADAPWHFRQPDQGLKGPTQYRDRALAVRGYTVVSVPYLEWRSLQGDHQRQQYLLQRFIEVGLVHPDP